MSEEEASLKSNECLVRVRAQVMTRDDSSGGWLPVDGGGLSLVAVRKVTQFITDRSNESGASQPVKTKIEFVITGNKTTDESVCLNCVLKRADDLEYHQVTPTFRHWGVNCKKFGLTFQSPADAKQFDVALEKALEELRSQAPEPSPKSRRGCTSEVTSDADSGSTNEVDEYGRIGRRRRQLPQPSLPLASRRSASPQLSSLSVPSPAHATSRSSSHQALAAKRLSSLPATMTKSLSSPLQSSSLAAAHQKPPSQHYPMLPMRSARLSSSATYMVESSTKEVTPLVPHSDPPSADKYTYVDVISTVKRDMRRPMVRMHPDPPSGPHDYSYPSVDSISRSDKRDSISSIKVHNLDLMSSHRPPLLPIKNKRRRSRNRKSPNGNPASRAERVRCRFCHEFYSTDSNERGSCEFAPDPVKDGINKLTCIPALDCLLSRCPDADSECTNPCRCDTGGRNCFGRWFLMAALSLILPCLCCYIPLRGCHKLGLACGVCGGRHEAMESR